MGHYRDVAADLRIPTKTLRTASPDVWAGFGALHQAAVADGVLPAKVKELMALAIAVVKQCEGCIAYHALLMDAGTASVYGPRAFAAFHEFAGTESS